MVQRANITSLCNVMFGLIAVGMRGLERTPGFRVGTGKHWCAPLAMVRCASRSSLDDGGGAAAAQPHEPRATKASFAYISALHPTAPLPKSSHSIDVHIGGTSETARPGQCLWHTASSAQISQNTETQPQAAASSGINRPGGTPFPRAAAAMLRGLGLLARAGEAQGAWAAISSGGLARRAVSSSSGSEAQAAAAATTSASGKPVLMKEFQVRLYGGDRGPGVYGMRGLRCGALARSASAASRAARIFFAAARGGCDAARGGESILQQRYSNAAAVVGRWNGPTGS